ncbi:MAG: hypothetical protein RIT45_3376 [Pseudomonadota bacterium]|jgi:predicted RNA-binding protein Jag
MANDAPVPTDTELESPIGDGDDDSLQARAELATEIARTLCAKMGLEVEGVRGEVEDDTIVVYLDGELEGAANLDGRAWESMQFLLNKAVQKTGGRRCRLQLKVDGFRSRRAAPLDKVAGALAQKAAQLGRVITLGPLAADDLRAWGNALQRQRGTSVAAVGAQEARRLVITPEGLEADGNGRNRRRRRRKRGGRG